MKTLNIILLCVLGLSFSIFASKEANLPEVIPEIQEVTNEGKVLTKSEKEGSYYGKASYYGVKWNGRLTANGEIFDCAELTCASPTLPFNTVLKVTNLDNNKSVIVRVNDRGPFKINKSGSLIIPLEPHPRRVLDLSRKSFKTIGDLSKGIINIKYEVVGF